ncbi:MAG TPA: NADH-quinone oxidoreductase subunit J [Pyrinomonadaceae bacterium]|jgi:NADH-quinone oxidoreductase subunit J|nr:NADH-quinone oxidoreductase subunit J [Pyrinomonadaceae bacterium]
MISTLLFILFGGLAIGSALAVVAQRNPLYSAIALVGVFLSLSSLYLMLAAPFIAAVQVIVYAGAIMVLVVFVIMLLNITAEEHKRPRLAYLVPVAVVLGGILIGEVAFILKAVPGTVNRVTGSSDVGLTKSIGVGLFTTYLLPFEITSILLLMALVGAMTLARRTAIQGTVARLVTGSRSASEAATAPQGAQLRSPEESH